jgi:hypothetical protein
MTQAVHLVSVAAAKPVHTCAHAATQPTPTPAQQAAIENALTMALYFVRQPGNAAANVWAATARTNRALTLLKRVNEGVAVFSPANVLGRG